MQEEAAVQPGYMSPPTGSIRERPSDAAPAALRSSVKALDAGRQMDEMERLFGAGGHQPQQMEALATLRCWQFDPRFDSASRARASALVWKFQPNPWDEV